MAQPRHRSRRALDLSVKSKSRPAGNRIRKSFRSPDDDPHIRAYRDATQSQQFEDPFKDQAGLSAGGTGSLIVIDPPYSFESLLRLPRDNNTLRQCVDAMVTNIEGHGWRLEYIGPEGEEEGAAAKAEKVTLQNLLKFPNADHSLQELRERVRRDLEYIGNAYMEIGRDANTRVCLVAHVPGHLVRLTTKDENEVEVVVDLPREGTGAQQRVRKRFRRFVQIVGGRTVYFKEYGDTRSIDPKTGRENTELSIEEQATELIHLSLYAPGTPYGLPRWINQFPAIIGSRQAELTNLDFFHENAIPAMVLMVSGGMVTQASLDDIEEMFLSARGRKSFNRLVVIEAHGDEEAATADGTIPAPRLEMKGLQSDRQRDALFQEYDKNNMIKVRSSFRLPPVFIGLSQDYTHATARTSFAVAESQVFGPERTSIDSLWDLKILGTYEPKFWSMRSLPPSISDPTEIVNAIEKFDVAGALTPNVAIGLANDFFDLEIPFAEGEWGDFPFSLTIAMIDGGIMPSGLKNLTEKVLFDLGDGGGLDNPGDRQLFDLLQNNFQGMRKAIKDSRVKKSAPRYRTRRD